jgi:CrcB protein
MSAAVAVFLGGGLGSLARFGIGRWISTSFSSGFPWGTMLVNVVGSLVLGVLAGYAAQRPLSTDTHAFLAVGVLGGFTTYSSFNLETLQLWTRSGPLVAGGYALAMFVACLAAGAAGARIARLVLG